MSIRDTIQRCATRRGVIENGEAGGCLDPRAGWCARRHCRHGVEYLGKARIWSWRVARAELARERDIADVIVRVIDARDHDASAEYHLTCSRAGKLPY